MWKYLDVNSIKTQVKGILLRYTLFIWNITFYNNAGVDGGGMSFYSTQIYLVCPVIFEKNKADFGGAIYIERAAIESYDFGGRYSTTLEQITFSSNFAVTLGDDIFIKDGSVTWFIPSVTFPCINKTKTNHVTGDHIISLPYKIDINP